MTIREVCKKYDVTADILCYYERAGKCDARRWYVYGEINDRGGQKAE
ncbi:hypothetical protein [Moryella indoligenes]|nr:hypothetical protein [Moryella indoligenes]